MMESGNGGINMSMPVAPAYAAPPEMQGEIQRLIKKLDNM